MATGTITYTITCAGLTLSGTLTRTAEGSKAETITVPAGVAGAMTASSAGVDGMATGHGFVTSDIIDLHWDDPSTGARKSRRGLTVDTDAASTITFDDDPAAEGDALPAEDVAVVVSARTTISCLFDGDLVDLLVAVSSRDGVADFRDSGGSELVLTLTGTEPYMWAVDGGVTNPVAGDDIISIIVSNATITAGTFNFAAIYDSVS